MIDSIDKITVPTLVLDSEDDLTMGGQSPAFFEHLNSLKTYILFKTAVGAGDHCQVGNLPFSNKRVF